MNVAVRIGACVVAVAVMVVTGDSLGAGRRPAEAVGAGGYQSVRIERLEGGASRVSYVVFRALDRDGFCDAAAFGAVSLHPVLTDAPNDTMVNGVTGLPNPRATLDVYIDAGDGVITETNTGPVAAVRSVSGLRTFSTYANARLGSPVTAFPPLREGATDECQAWVKIVSASDTPANVLVLFHDDSGDVGFDRLINAPRTNNLTLNPRWSLASWPGPDAVPVSDAVAGTGLASGGANVANEVSAIYAWDEARGAWLAYFPAAANVPGANTLATLQTGHPYWFALVGSQQVTWAVRTP